jgi:hypothetical protein
MIKEQIKWKQQNKDELWDKIIKNKILNQAMLLNKIGSDKYNLILSYIDEVKKGDKIAQLVIELVVPTRIEIVEELSPTVRGDNGFGSSGR